LCAYIGRVVTAGDVCEGGEEGSDRIRGVAPNIDGRSRADGTNNEEEGGLEDDRSVHDLISVEGMRVW
jgi:hypothetical protein